MDIETVVEMEKTRDRMHRRIGAAIFSARAENTRLFGVAYRNQRIMRSAGDYEEKDMSTSKEVEVLRSGPFDPSLDKGQIRLLSQTDRITYVVLLRRLRATSFVTMPFSQYDFPATEEEFNPEYYYGGMYLNTLQVWNTRIVEDELLRKSWLIGSLQEQDHRDALEFWEHSINRDPLPARLRVRTGISIRRGDDPRCRYMKEESANMAPLDSEE